jgi:hypothetical protein
VVVAVQGVCVAARAGGTRSTARGSDGQRRMVGWWQSWVDDVSRSSDRTEPVFDSANSPCPSLKPSRVRVRAQRATMLVLHQAYGAYPHAGLHHLVLPQDTVLVSIIPIVLSNLPSCQQVSALPLSRRRGDPQCRLSDPRPHPRFLGGLSWHNTHRPIHLFRRSRFSHENRTYAP